MPEAPVINTLDNQLQVIFIPHSEAESVYLRFLSLAGSCQENVDEIGVAHFLEHTLFNGTKSFPSSKKLEDFLSRVGGTSNGQTSREWVEYWTLTLKGDAEAGFHYLSEIVNYPLLRPADIEREKRVIEQEIRRFTDDPGSYLFRKSLINMFPEDRLGKFNSGNIEDIRKINRQKLKRFLNRYYTSGNSILAVSGNEKPSRIFSLANKYFSTLRKGPRSPLDKPRIKRKPRLFVENRSDLTQAKLSINFHSVGSNSEKSPAVKILSSLLGEGLNSRLVQLIREKKGYAYNISTQTVFLAEHGVFCIYAGLDERKINTTLNLIHQELQKITARKISSEELRMAIKKVEAPFIIQFEKPAPRADFYSQAYLFDSPFKTPRDLLQRLRSLTKRELIEAAETLFHAPPKITVLAPNLKKENLKIPWQ